MLKFIIFVFLVLIIGCSNQVVDSPGARYGHDLCYDELRNRVILFGGFHNDGRPLGDTWIWDSHTWMHVNTKGPKPRKWPAMAFHSKIGFIVLFGGRTGVGQNGISLADTWIWNGKSWIKLEINGPPGRDQHRMVYDKKRQRIVLFGGWDGTKVLDDVWEFDGEKWEQVMSGPTARAPFGLAYDEKHQNTILFGGKSLVDFFDDTWTWDGMKWNKHDIQGPSPRAFHAMTYDPDNEEVILFSGRNGNNLFNDTWSWNGQNWKRLSNKGPIKRGIYSLVYNRVSHTAMFYGSGIRKDNEWVLDDETWFWKNNAWQKLYR